MDTINFYCAEQAKRHNTDLYDLVEGNEPCPVLRRGESFFFSVQFKRRFDSENDGLRLNFIFGPKEHLSSRTFINLLVTRKTAFDRDQSQWDVCVSREEENEVVLQVQIPSIAAVGLWRLRVITTTRDSPDQARSIYQCKENLFILFNPWCTEDTVYMEDETWRQEYVLCDSGKIYCGTLGQPVGRPWAFGQFSAIVLPACEFLLRKSGLDYRSRGNPVKIARTISAVVNSLDDRGVLRARWSEPYDDGTAPWKWTGSTAILKQYLDNGGQPVKYGQCWVFSGVCTTVFRALGIPCRSVTNYVSAHDTNENITIERYYDADGTVIKPGMNSDSVWNFHVWNDCWMARPDIPPGYGGWQAVDATPQEQSGGIFRAGPAPVVAIRRGEINQTYDCPFIFAEVNADCIYWKKDETCETGWKQLFTNTSEVGRLIVTKKIGHHSCNSGYGLEDMEDITHEYKSREGSSEERMAVLNALRCQGGEGHISCMPPSGNEDVKFCLLDIEKVMIGKSIPVIFKVENVSSENRTVNAVLSCRSVYYTGKSAREVKRVSGSYVLQPGQTEHIGIKVTFDDYYDKLVDYSMMKANAIATVRETNRTWISEDDFRVEKPSLSLQIEGEIKKDQPFCLQISFTNPLQRSLYDCEVAIEGPGLAEPRRTRLRDFLPGEDVIHTETLVPKKCGSRKISAVFSSRQLIEVVGSQDIIVEH